MTAAHGKGRILLKPLGDPQPNSVKYFATVEVLELIKDRAWLARITTTVSQHWRQKNQGKKGCGADTSGNGHPSENVSPVLAGR